MLEMSAHMQQFTDGLTKKQIIYLVLFNSKIMSNIQTPSPTAHMNIGILLNCKTRALSCNCVNIFLSTIHFKYIIPSVILRKLLWVKKGEGCVSHSFSPSVSNSLVCYHEDPTNYWTSESVYCPMLQYGCADDNQLSDIIVVTDFEHVH